MKKLVLASVVLLGVVAMSVVFNGWRSGAAAHPWGGGKAPWATEKKLDLAKYIIAAELDLSVAQKAEMDRIAADLISRHDSLRATHQEFKTGFAEVFKQDQVSADDLKQLFESHRPAFEIMVEALADQIAAFHTMLTPEQRSVFMIQVASHADNGCRFGRYR